MRCAVAAGPAPDDCCLEPTFATDWPRCLRLLPEADVVVLGFYRGTMPLPVQTVLLPSGIEVRVSFLFIGTHCYVVTRPGAERLLRLVEPVHLPVDNFLASAMPVRGRGRPRPRTTASFRLVRGFVWMRSLAWQCLWHRNRGISHDRASAHHRAGADACPPRVGRCVGAAPVPAHAPRTTGGRVASDVPLAAAVPALLLALPLALLALIALFGAKRRRHVAGP